MNFYSFFAVALVSLTNFNCVPVPIVPTNALNNTPLLNPINHIEACIGQGDTVLINTSKKMLYLCNNSVTEGVFLVGLGENGVGKTKQGDKKTPLGKYFLGRPRPSGSGFKTFIPVGYPTIKQKRKGYTGSAIGIHGPQRDWADWPPGTYGKQDWTLGCIAVGSDAEIDTITDWLLSTGVGDVVIL